ncbi:hypothetical protein WR25_02239 isoform B [Diploscapter pachys]|uniref:Copper type II ascorbate-dependent monooxygenase C-terminal domain-containing protein n=1 Tax=Diploscapter pachys TaxID=2018661 RepID=A0A2A2LEI2_9BILA|nr:hypothetical protein WR25_02239 isoform B [Diploscapter pachys]
MPLAGNTKDYTGVKIYMTTQPPPMLAAVYALASSDDLPPKLDRYYSNMSCVYNSSTPIHPFAFRPHTHVLGRIVSGYFLHGNEWTAIGKRNPLWPQIFEPINRNLTIQKGDVIAASCHFTTKERTEKTYNGMGSGDEMCNYYIIFWWDASLPKPEVAGQVCWDSNTDAMSKYPVDGWKPMPPNVEFDDLVHYNKEPFGVSQEAFYSEIDGFKLGQVVGLAFCPNGHLLIFRRPANAMGPSAFDSNNVLTNKTTISEAVILEINFNAHTPKITKRLGENKFYLPHGIYMDSEGYIYTTDIGSHTIAKWSVYGNSISQVWEAGVELQPGPGKDEFCKPTAVTRVKDSVFVTDGYCNNRVVELDASTGQWKSSFGSLGDSHDQFNLPHDIISTAKGNLQVADRNNGRVHEIRIDGQHLAVLEADQYKKIYSMDPSSKHIFVAPDKTDQYDENPLFIFVARTSQALTEYAFGPEHKKKFGIPHVIRVSKDDEDVYIGDVGLEGLWKFKVHKEKPKSHFVGKLHLLTPNLEEINTLYIILIVLVCIIVLDIFIKRFSKFRLFRKTQSKVIFRRNSDERRCLLIEKI